MSEGQLLHKKPTVKSSMVNKPTIESLFPREYIYGGIYNNIIERDLFQVIVGAELLLSQKGMNLSSQEIIERLRAIQNMEQQTPHKTSKKKKEKDIDVSLSDILKDVQDVNVEIGSNEDYYSTIDLD